MLTITFPGNFQRLVPAYALRFQEGGWDSVIGSAKAAAGYLG
ncbi:MAG: hypothetical protein WAL47_03410 [Pyrinomonadaceae bacterium]